MKPSQTVSTLAISLLLGASAAAQGFDPARLYLYSGSIFGASASAVNGAILEVDPVSGATTTLVGPIAGSSRGGAMVYEPGRDALLYFGGTGTVSDPRELRQVDSAGTVSVLGHGATDLCCMTANGRGLVYMRDVLQSAGTVQCLDAAGAIHDVLDASGTVPFSFSGGFDYERLLYHAPTHSLFAAAGLNVVDCTSGAWAGMVVRRVALSADGARAIGPELCSQFEVSTSAEKAIGLSLMGDDILLCVDTNANQAEPRMLRVDPHDLTITPFATSDHAFSATLSSGTYSHALGRAVILDSGNDVLRRYAQGQAGPGTITPQGTPSVSSPATFFEEATLLDIPVGPCAGTIELYGDGAPGLGGFTPSLSATGCPVQDGDVALHLGSVRGGATGAFVIGFTRLAVPILGGTLLVDPVFSIPVSVGGTPGVAGAGFTSIPVPLGIQATPLFDFQVLFLDAATSDGLSFTNGLEIVIG